jgi:hypothetical protein
MDGLVEQLFRLESAKHKALILIDAPAYDASVQAQVRLLAETKEPIAKVANVEQLLALSQLITLNTRLLNNLLATTTLFAAIGYTADGQVSASSAGRRVVVEA